MQNSHASIGRPRFTLGGWALYARTVARDLKEFVRHHHLAASGPTKLVCWTLNVPRERRWLLRLGVHAILTDFPAALRKEYEEEWRAQSAKE
jgi:glycerophosphoryl diester phosphodiesterase